MTVDVLVFAAHPDDAELAAGGLIAVSVKRGHTVGIVDFTRGELGSRGTPEVRAREAAAAAEVLGVTARENLGLPDGGLAETFEARRLVVEAIRKYRPTLVAAPNLEDLHPDHAVAGRVVAAAFYPSGFVNYETGSDPWRPAGLVHYMNHFPFEPSFVLDISDVWETRMAAVIVRWPNCWLSVLSRETNWLGCPVAALPLEMSVSRTRWASSPSFSRRWGRPMQKRHTATGGPRGTRVSKEVTARSACRPQKVHSWEVWEVELADIK